MLAGCRSPYAVAVLGACVPVQSLAWEPCPVPRTGASSPPFRFDCESRLLAVGRFCRGRAEEASDGCDRAAPGGAGCAQRDRDGLRAGAWRERAPGRACGRVSDDDAGTVDAARLVGGARG